MRFEDVITIYRFSPQRGTTAPTVSREIVGGVFWDGSYGLTLSKRGADSSDRVMIMLHESKLRERINPGDVIARGEYGDITSAADLRALGAEFVVVTNVHDCRFGGADMRHWEITGK